MNFAVFFRKNMRIWNIAYVSVIYLTLKLKEVKMQIESLIFILFPKEKAINHNTTSDYDFL